MALILVGDCREMLATLEPGSVHTCITSPPYWGLRDYGHAGQLGLEETPDEYVAGMVDVFRAVGRVLRTDGTLWLNLGDSYAGGGAIGRNDADRDIGGRGGNRLGSGNPGSQGSRPKAPGLKPKDLCGIPWRVAFALQADGWYLRSDIIWAKPNPMPESVTDRPTKAHEYLFLFAHPESKGRYYYDADAVKERGRPEGSHTRGRASSVIKERRDNGRDLLATHPSGRNKRSVWTIPTQPFPGAHFAVMPPGLVIPCVKAGTSERGCCGECGAPLVRVVEDPDFSGAPKRKTTKGDGTPDPRGYKTSAGQAWQAWRNKNPTTTTGWARSCNHSGDPVPCTVLDPFAGAGTVGVVATGHGRRFVGIELSPEYAAMAEARIANPAANLRKPDANPAQVSLFGGDS